MTAIDATTRRVPLLPKQADFIAHDEKRWCGYSGCRAGGKSYAACWKARKRASVPMAREFLGRMNETDLRRSTLKTLLEGDGELPPVLEPGSYTHNKAEKEIKLHAGGEIIYGGFDKGIAAKVMGGTGSKSSMNLTGATLDEAIEIPESLVIQLDGSVRSYVRGLSNQINVVCNPGPPSNWVAKKFGLSSEYPSPHEDAWAVSTTIFENKFLRDGFAESFARSMDPGSVAYKRYVLGEWVGSDGLVYDRFSRTTHVVESPFEPKSVSYAIDPGYTDPFVILEIHEDYDGRMHVAREFYKAKTMEHPGVTHDEGLNVLQSMMLGREAEVVIDSAAPDLVEAAVRRGIRAEPASKGQGSIVAGINMVQRRLDVQDDGKPRLTIDPECVNTIREFESYEWKRTADGLTEKPEDRDNHALDALRYRVMQRDGGAAPFVFVAAGSGERAAAIDRREMTDDERRAADPEWGW